MNKKGQIAGVVVFIVLAIVGLVTVGMLESESNFMSNTISDFIGASTHSGASLLIRFVVPVFFAVMIVGIILTVRGAVS